MRSKVFQTWKTPCVWNCPSCRIPVMDRMVCDECGVKWRDIPFRASQRIVIQEGVMYVADERREICE